MLTAPKMKSSKKWRIRIEI